MVGTLVVRSYSKPDEACGHGCNFLYKSTEASWVFISWAPLGTPWAPLGVAYSWALHFDKRNISPGRLGRGAELADERLKSCFEFWLAWLGLTWEGRQRGRGIRLLSLWVFSSSLSFVVV